MTPDGNHRCKRTGFSCSCDAHRCSCVIGRDHDHKQWIESGEPQGHR